jgi:hypothetical protein
MFSLFRRKQPTVMDATARRMVALSAKMSDQTLTNSTSDYSIISLIEMLLTAQLLSRYEHPRDAHTAIMTSKVAAGYVFGFHDSCLRMLKRLDPSDPTIGLSLMQASYQHIFGHRPGSALFELSVQAQKDRKFQIGRLSGGEEYAEFIGAKSPPLGLQRILFLGFDAEAVYRTLSAETVSDPPADLRPKTPRPPAEIDSICNELDRICDEATRDGGSKPFHTNTTREERREWFARTPPWNGVPATVTDAILDGFIDKVLLEAFVLSSTERGLVHKYEQLGLEYSNANIIRARISQILCDTGNRVLVDLAGALKERELDAGGELARIAANLFEPAISLTKDQIGGYNGMAALYALAGKRAKSHDYAKRGLAVLEEMRRDPRSQAMKDSIIFSSSDILDQTERLLRSYLEH